MILHDDELVASYYPEHVTTLNIKAFQIVTNGFVTYFRSFEYIFALEVFVNR
jgi:hypothetical protein